MLISPSMKESEVKPLNFRHHLLYNWKLNANVQMCQDFFEILERSKMVQILEPFFVENIFILTRKCIYKCIMREKTKNIWFAFRYLIFNMNNLTINMVQWCVVVYRYQEIH